MFEVFWDAIYKYELFDDKQLKKLRKRAILRGGAMILAVLMTGFASLSIGATADSVVLYIFVPLMIGATIIAVMAILREEEIRRELLRRKNAKTAEMAAASVEADMMAAQAAAQGGYAYPGAYQPMPGQMAAMPAVQVPVQPQAAPQPQGMPQPAIQPEFQQTFPDPQPVQAPQTVQPMADSRHRVTSASRSTIPPINVSQFNSHAGAGYYASYGNHDYRGSRF